MGKSGNQAQSYLTKIKKKAAEFPQEFSGPS